MKWIKELVEEFGCAEWMCGGMNLGSQIGVDLGGQDGIEGDARQRTDFNGRGRIEMIDQIAGAEVDHAIHLEPVRCDVHRLHPAAFHLHPFNNINNYYD